MYEFVKIFPEYEDVFYDAIENCRKHFLPLCSINLKAIDPGINEWLHFVCPKEVYDGPVGEGKNVYFTNLTKEDMLGFEVIDGKYRFDADWNYFRERKSIENYNKDYTDADIGCSMNEAMYQLKKNYFKKNGRLYDKDFYRPGLQVNDIRRLERLRNITVADIENDPVSEYLAERIDSKHWHVLDEVNTAKHTLNASNYDGAELLNKPDLDNFSYIGCLEGSDFLYTAPDHIYLFYSFQLHKAVICLGNT